MTTRSLRQLLIGSLAIGIGVTNTFAHDRDDSPQRVEQKRTDLSGAPGMEVIASIAEDKPGDTIDLHLHHGVEMVYVIQGASVQIAGMEPMTLATGSTLMNLRDVKHAGFKVIGTTALKLFTVHVTDKEKPLYEYASW